MKFNTKYAVILSLCLFLLVGCHRQTYPGPKLAKEHVAFIKGHERHDTWVHSYVAAVFGKDVKWKNERPDDIVDVLPGKYRVVCNLTKMTHTLFGFIVEHAEPKSLLLEAQAGHVYICEGKWINRHDTPMWIVDELTGAVVAGKKRE